MIKNNISKVLKKCDLSQARLAEDAELSTGMVSQFASGRSIPTADELWRICRELSCREEQLYGPEVLVMIHGTEKPELPGGKSYRGKHVLITDELAEDVDSYATRYGLTRNEAARTLIIIGLREPEKEQVQYEIAHTDWVGEMMENAQNHKSCVDDPADG